LETIVKVGEQVVSQILGVAALLKETESPGLVAIALLFGLAVALCHLMWVAQKRRGALQWLKNIINQTANEREFSERFIELNQIVEAEGEPGHRTNVAVAWDEYQETLIPHRQADGPSILRNSVRPGDFFNLEDLHFGPGFWRILPGLFVTTGLFLTFLGLIAALNTMVDDSGAITTSAMAILLTVASAKFIMSLTGLFCSIVFTIALRLQMGKIEKAVNELNRSLEKRLSFLSLEYLAEEQLMATREQREHFRTIGMELVAELGRPLREELPNAISTSIGDAMKPLINQLGQISSDGVGEMVKDLSSQFSDDVGRALTQASERIGQAGDHIGSLIDRMDQSSGRMGAEMETAVGRLGQAVDDLRASMTKSAEATSGAFTQGAESILTAMNTTLQGIRDNTEEGALAMSAAASDMRAAAEGIRQELEGAAKSGAEAARFQMEQAGTEASSAIGTAGNTVIEAFGKTSVEIARITDEMAQKAGQDLVGPMGSIADKLEEMVTAISQGTEHLRRASDGIRSGAEASNDAASSFRGSADSLVAAADPLRASVQRIEGSTKELADATRQVAANSASNSESVTQVLTAAQEALGGQNRLIEASLESLTQALERMRGQGDRLDDMDEKLGSAFDAYTTQVAAAVEGLFGHVREMQDKLNPALDTMREIVEQAEQFVPQSRAT
jgi:ABC-type transporter Mla subunit MlaD